MLSKSTKKQKMSFSRSSTNQIVIFGVQFFFKIWHVEIFKIKIRRVVPTMWTLANGKTDLGNFLVQNWFHLFGCKIQSFHERWQQGFRLVKKLTMGEAEFNHLMRLRNQLVIAVEKIAKEENLSPLLIPTMSKDMNEQIKLAHKIVDVMDWANKKNRVTAAV